MSKSAQATPSESPALPLRVLVAEDEALIRLDLVELLTGEGYEVVGEASDGEQALALARELVPDLVVMDVKMPKMDGITAAAAIAAAAVYEHPGSTTPIPHQKYIRVVSETDSPVQQTYIKSKDGLYVAAAIRKPKGDGPFPAIIIFHGAPGGRGISANSSAATREWGIYHSTQGRAWCMIRAVQ